MNEKFKSIVFLSMHYAYESRRDLSAWNTTISEILVNQKNFSKDLKISEAQQGWSKARTLKMQWKTWGGSRLLCLNSLVRDIKQAHTNSCYIMMLHSFLLNN